mgnify:CR=1 FL=1
MIKTIIKILLWLIDPDHREKNEIAMDDMKKFTHIEHTNFQSDFGTATRAFRTVPYQAWKLKTTTKQLIAADRHRVIREDGTCAWLEDLNKGDRIQTDAGVEEVEYCKLDVNYSATLEEIENKRKEVLKVFKNAPIPRI